MKMASLHLRNKHQSGYDFKALANAHEPLDSYLAVNKNGHVSIDFYDPEAVKSLNRALLIAHYGIEYWDFPQGYLCPPIPGRADYIHHMQDLMLADIKVAKEVIPRRGKKLYIPKKPEIRCLDIGVGANCIYPILGVAEYDWHFLGTDIDPVALESAEKIVSQNSVLKNKVRLKLQKNKDYIFEGILSKKDHFHLTICNPPFHGSKTEAMKGAKRKIANLQKEKKGLQDLVFAGKQNELWYDGGEKAFIKRMIKESKLFAHQCNWFSTWVSKESNVGAATNMLSNLHVADMKVIPMKQGNKASRIIAWSFMRKRKMGN